MPRSSRALLGVVIAVLLLAIPASASADSLSGHVKSSSGIAVSSATVELLSTSTGATVASGTTGLDGSYSVTVAAGTYDLRVTPPVGSPYATFNAANRVISGATTLEIQLSSSVGFSGTVKDPNGVALSGVTVQWGGQSTTTNASGAFSLSVQPGSSYLDLSRYGSGGKTPLQWGLESNLTIGSNGLSGLAITVPTVAVDTLVVKPDGTTPVASASLTAGNNTWSSPGTLVLYSGDTTGRGYFSSNTSTNASGRGTLNVFKTAGTGGNTAVPPSTVTDAAGTTFDLTGTTTDTTKTVALPAGVTFSGTYKTRAGAAINGATISLTSGGLTTTRSTNASGQFSFQVVPGTYSVSLAYGSGLPGYTQLYTTVTVPAGGTTGFAFTAPTVVVDVLAQRPDGTPISGASVQSASNGQSAVGSLSLYPGDTSGYGTYSSATGVTGANGHVNLTILPIAGSTNNSVTPPSGATDLAQTTFSLAGVTSDTSKTVTLTQSVPLSGTVTDRQGTPMPNAYFQYSGNGISGTAYTNSQGQFSFSVLPGNYNLYVQGNGSTGKVPTGYWTLQTTVSVPAGGKTGLNLVAPGIAVDVTVVGPAGNPISGVSLNSSAYGAAVTYSGDTQGIAQYSSSATTGADGHATLKIFPIGSSSGNTATPPSSTGLTQTNFDLSGFSKDSSLVISFNSSPTYTTPPTVNCPTADSTWHDANVTFTCTASPVSATTTSPGLANAADASFSLSTNVAAGSQTATAATGTKKICDKADNCTTAGPITSNKIDRQAPTVTFTTPADGKYFHQTANAPYTATCTDPGGSGCATASVSGLLDTSTLGAFTESVTATDNVGRQSTAVLNYGVDTDEQPEVTTTGGSAAWTEADNATSTPVAVDPGVTVADVNDDNLASANVWISGGFVAGEDVLAFSSQNGITGSYKSSTGVLTLTGEATKANWATALQSVTYTNSSDTPTGATRTVSFRVNDAILNSTVSTRDVTLAAVNDTPVVTASSGSASWSEGNVSASVPVAVDPALTVADGDNTSLASAVVKVTGGFVTGQDVLGFIDQNGITGDYEATTGTLTLTGPATTSAWQTALRSVTYDNSNDAPNTGDRTIRFTVSDGTATSTAATRTVTLSSVDDSPSVVSPNLPLDSSDLPIGTNGTVSALVRSGNDLYLGGSFTAIGPATGNGALLDAGTGTAASVSGPNGNVNAVVSDGSGGYYIGGDFTQFGSVTRNRIAHLDADGTLDTVFNPNVNSTVTSLVLDGTTLYAGGSFTQVNGTVARSYLAAFDTTVPTSNVLPFNPSPNQRVNALLLSGTTLYAGGQFNQVNGNTASRQGVAAFDTTLATGNVRPFNPTVSGTVNALNRDGSTLYVGGSFSSVNGGTARNNLAAFDTTAATGNVLPFNPNPQGQVLALARTGATLFAGGSWAYVNSSNTYRYGLAAFDTTQATNNVLPFDANVNSQVNSLAISGSTLYAGGYFTSIGGQPRRSLAAFDVSDGTAKVTSFNPSMGNGVLALAVGGGKVYAGGAFTIANANARNYIAKVDTSTNTVSSFDPNVNSPVQALLLNNGVLYAGGNFTSVNGNIPRSRLAGFDITQPVNSVTDFNPNVNSTVNALAMSGTTLYAGGSFTQVNGVVPRGRLASFDTTLNVSNVTGADPNLNGTVNALLLSGTTLYTGGSFTTVNGTMTRNRLAALNTKNVQLAPTAFDPNLNSTVNALLLSGSTLYAGGSFSVVNSSTSRQFLAAFGTATGTATSFNPSPNSTVNALAMSSSTLFVGGSFSFIGGASRTGVAALDATQPTNNAMAFDPGLNGGGNALALGGGKLSLGGSFSVTRSGPQSNLATFSIPTTGVTTWTEANNGPSTPVAIDNRLYVSDPDSAGLVSATVKITTNYTAGEDVLSFANDGSTMGNIVAAPYSNGALSLSSAGGNATPLQWQSALRSVKYNDTSHSPVTDPRTIEISASDTNSTSAVAQRQIKLVAVDDSPVVTTTAGTTPWQEDATPSSAVVVDATVGVTDSDSATVRRATVSISAGFAVGQDVLAFTPQHGITGTYSAGTGVLSLTGTATPAEYADALRSVTFDNTNDAPSTTTRTISYAVSDASAFGNAATRNVSIAVNDDPPVASASAGATTWTEGDNTTSTPVAIDPALGLTDPDSTKLPSATVTIAANYSATEDSLSFTNDLATMGNIAVVSNTGGVLSLTSSGASATVAQWQAALRAVKYTNSSDSPSTLDRTIEFRAKSGTVTSSAAKKTVKVVSADDTPVLTASGATTFTEGNGVPSTAIAVAPAVTVADLDNASLQSAVVRISGGLKPAEDQLVFADQLGITGSYDGANGKLTLTGPATKADWQTALRSVKYGNDSENPDTGDRTIDFTIDDGAKTSAAASRTVHVVAVDDSPKLSGPSTVTWTQSDGTAVSLGGGVTVTDGDTVNMVSAKVTVGGFDSSQDVLAFTGDAQIGDITQASNTGGVLTLTSASGATKAQWEHALSLVTYDNTASPVHNGTRNVSITINDGNTNSSPLAISLVIAADRKAVLSFDTRPAANSADWQPTFTFRADETVAFTCAVYKQGNTPSGFDPCPAGNRTTGSFTPTARLVNGDYTVEVRAIDSDGNASDPITYDWTIAKAPPTVSVAGPALTRDPTPQFTLTPSEGNVTYKCAVDSGSFVDCDTPYTVPSQADGSHTLKVKVFDAAGNVNNPVATKDFRVDTTAPSQPTLGSYPDDLSNDPNPRFTFGSSDPAPGSGVASYACKLNSQTDPCDGGQIDYSNLADGDYTFTVTATDQAGNTSTVRSWSFRIDQTGPTASIVRPAVGARYSTTQTVTASYTCADTAPGTVTMCSAEVDGTPVADGAQLPTSAGIHTFTLRLKDDSGNTGTVVRTYRGESFDQLALDDDPLAYYRLGDGPGSSTFGDRSTNRFDGEFKNDTESEPQGVSGDNNTARHFKGSQGYGYVNGIAAPVYESTLMTWVKFDDVRDSDILDHGYDNGLFLTNKRFAFRHVGTTIKDERAGSGYDVVPNRWYLVIGRWNGRTMDLFVADQTQSKYDPPVKVASASNRRRASGRSTFYLGFGEDQPWLKGSLDEVMYFSRAISDAHIAELWLADPPAKVEEAAASVQPAPETPAASSQSTSTPATATSAPQPVAVASKPAAKKPTAKQKAIAKAKAKALARAKAKAKAKALAKKRAKARAHRRSN